MDEYLAVAEELSPPDDAEDAHDAFLEAARDARENVAETIDETADDAPSSDLIKLIFHDNPFAEVDEAACDLVEIAEAQSIALEAFTCDLSPGADVAGDNAVTVDVSEFTFNIESAPTTDTTGFVLTNSGEQPHEIALVRVDLDLTLNELVELAMTSEETPEGITDVGFTSGYPGEEHGLALEGPLTPGRYVMLCFFPDVDGTPHVAKGMIAEFTVE
jgi:hypothetical protein